MTKRSVVGWVLVLAGAVFGGTAEKTQTDQKPQTLAQLQLVRKLVYSPDGSFLLVYGTLGLGVWDTKTGKFRVRMEEKAPSPWDCIAISPDGKKAAAIAMYFSKKMGRDLKIWDVATGKLMEEQILPEWTTGKGPPFLEFSPDGAFLYSIWDKQILEAKLGGKNRLLAHKLDSWAPDQGGWGGTMVFDPHAKLLIVAHNNLGKPGAQLGFIHLAKEGEPQSVPLTDYVASMALSADGKTLAISFDRRFTGKPKLELWDTATFKRRTSLPADTRKEFQFYESMVFAPDGKTLAGVPFFTDSGIRRFFGSKLDVFDLEGKISQEITWRDVSGPITFSPDGKTLAVMGASGNILFVDPATGGTRRP